MGLPSEDATYSLVLMGLEGSTEKVAAMNLTR